ncbi:polysaccharide pyruvyl transferase family protein [Gordonia sp. (in: high G+C Gram-positive bacteria)]|uniref:polysaccharide pyruvyl transferase family protein n=1 Tax=Gordonia sp. (in: high G+C Gram-positive bacteria) TaxID=84139 RepID=UPI003C77B8A2
MSVLPSRPDVFSLTQRARRAVESRDVVYLVTTAGFPNFGDELIVEAWLRYLAVHRPLARVVVDSQRPGQAALLLRQANRRAVFVDTIWNLVQYASGDAAGPEVDRDAPWEWIARATTRMGVAPREGDGVELLLRANTIHIVGGGYLNNVWPHHANLVTVVAEAARVTGAKAIATGAGLTPGFTGAALERFRFDASTFEVFDVRDQPSADLLGSVPGASFTGDDAWLSPRVHRRPRAVPATGNVVLCAQSDLTDDFVWRGRTGFEALVEFIGVTLDEWEVAGSDVTVLECIPGLDVQVAERLGDRLAGSQRIPFLQAWRSGLPVSRGNTWLSTRFHPHLLAAAAGDSGVAVVSKPDYYATKHRSLTESGSQWTVVSGGDEVPARPNAGGYSPADSARNRSTKRALAASLYPIGVRLR